MRNANLIFNCNRVMLLIAIGLMPFFNDYSVSANPQKSATNKSTTNTNRSATNTNRTTTTTTTTATTPIHLVPSQCGNIGKWGYVDTLKKTQTIMCKYDAAHTFAPDGLARVRLNNKWGFIDKTGKEVITLKYDNASDFSEGLATVSINNKWGFIDKTGKEVIPFKYRFTSNFSEGLAKGTNVNAAETAYEISFIDKTGKEVIPFKYNYLHHDGYFLDGFASVGVGTFENFKNIKWGIIDKTGKEVVPLIFEDARSLGLGKLAVRLTEEGSWYFINKK